MVSCLRDQSGSFYWELGCVLLIRKIIFIVDYDDDRRKSFREYDNFCRSSECVQMMWALGDNDRMNGQFNYRHIFKNIFFLFLFFFESQPLGYSQCHATCTFCSFKLISQIRQQNSNSVRASVRSIGSIT